MVFKFAYFVELTKGYQPAKFQCWVKFYRGIGKHNDDVFMTSFHILGFEMSIFCETGYQLAKFQISQLSESNFTEVGIRHPKALL